MSQGLLRCNAGWEEGLELFQQPGLASFGQFVFPNPGDFPTQFSQRIIYAAIPRLVAGNLLSPERGIGLRLCPVFRTPVPEAAVDKHRPFHRRKNKVRFAGQF